jgi:hypothetical protein
VQRESKKGAPRTLGFGSSRPGVARLVLAAAAAGATLCACVELVPPLPARAAEAEERECVSAPDAKDDVRALESMNVLKASPIYHVATCSGAGQVFGVELVVSRSSAASSAELGRMLRCHGARGLLGQLDSADVANDPFWIPGSWVDVSVTSDPGHFFVKLYGDTVAGNLRVLNRAVAFARAHGAVASATAP